ncbi:MAG: enoyl-CoA hydratase/isomerase family protein [Gammaproteobacteria bacterium]|nr:enoyl-CoA hydratase/isomerase family protein [Gammaproteobacteria bacterium]
MRLSELEQRLQDPAQAEALSLFGGCPSIVVEVDEADLAGRESRPSNASRGASSVPVVGPAKCPVIGIVNSGADEADMPALLDVAVPSLEEAERIASAVGESPVAAMTLVGLTRVGEDLTIPDRLITESLAYSALQHGAEFQGWLAGRDRKPPAPEPEDPPILIDRQAGELHLLLNRPQKRNAYSGAMRDALCEALSLATQDPTIERIVLAGKGPSFSAGGDLDEFGEATDAGVAHAARTTRSAARLMHSLRDKVEVHLHGACVGAGIELPAFAGHLRATRDAFFMLPEVRFGLIPGAGGTASILSRVGRLNLNYMALTGDRIDAQTALAWGLIDAIDDA